MSAGTLFDALRSAGYDPDRLPSLLVPGDFYRIPAPGRKKSDRNGWVTLIEDGVAVYGDWTTGERTTWRAASDNHRTAANDNGAIITRAAIAKRKANDRAQAESHARKLWEQAKPATPGHSYLQRKGIDGAGLRIDATGRLVLPVYRAGSNELISLQHIDGDGEKRFLKNASTDGGCFTIPGTMPRIFCEGYATGATIHAATGRQTVVCLNAGNLPTVTAAMAQAGDVVAADNDNAPKVGERFGRDLATYGAGHRAAMRAGLPFFMPHTPGHDWNDEGTEATAVAFSATPTSAAQVMSAWSLQREDLKGATAKELTTKLQGVATPQDAATLAFSVASRMFMNAPTQTSLAGIRAHIEATLPAGLVHPATLDGIMGRLDSAMEHRRDLALSAVTIPPHILARHQHEICEKLSPLPGDECQGVIVLWSPMGSGKTRDVGKPYVQWAANNTDTKPLAICHRVSLVHDMAKALGISHYGQIDAETVFDPSIRGLATCLPSITTRAHAHLIDQAEYLFIDEISQVLRFLSAKDHCRTREADSEGVYNRLRELVTNAKCVMVADAGCDARTIDFLESCRPGEKFRIIEMRAKQENIAAAYHVGSHAPAAVVGECLVELAAGGRVWMATESARRARNLGAFFEAQGYRVMAVHANNKGNIEQAAFLAEPERLSREYDVVIASPVIGSGLSITHDKTGEWFTLGAFIGGGHRVTPADAAQALRRVRYLKRFSLAMIPNSEVGKQSGKSIKSAWLEASDLDGNKALANSFTDLVAEIIATDDNARADFAAGLLWQLDRSKWTLYHRDAADPETAATMSVMDKAQDEAHRAALLAAPVLDDDEAKKLEAKASRTEQQNITLEAWRIRRALNVSDLDGDTLDFWDNGAAVRRLDRFSAWQGTIAAFDDTAENPARRRFLIATAKATQELLEGFDPDSDRVTDEMGEMLLDRMLAKRHLLAHLGIVPKSYGVWMEDKNGKPIEPARPKNARQEMAGVLARMGLAWRGIRARVTTPALIPLEDKGQGGYKMGRVYEVTAESLATIRMWAERRNAGRKTKTIEAANDAAMPVQIERAICIGATVQIRVGHLVAKLPKVSPGIDPRMTLRQFHRMAA